VPDPDHRFAKIISLGFGGSLSLTDGEVGFVQSISRELGNHELFEMTLERAEEKFDRGELKGRLEFMSWTESESDCDLTTIASHFYRFGVSDFDHISSSVLSAILNDPHLVLRSEDSLFEIISRRASEDDSFFGLLEFVRFEFLSSAVIRRAFDFVSNSLDLMTFGIWSNIGRRLCLSVNPGPEANRFQKFPFGPLILTAIPEILSGFEDGKLELLYRGSRDGFEAATFHRMCDGHSPTLTIVLSDRGWIFGGYTTLVWTSRGEWPLDPGLKSFLFTIGNPDNPSPRLFKQSRPADSIYTAPGYGPTFGGGHDLHICDKCSTSKSSYSNLGPTYANDARIPANAVLAGERTFIVKEIEVFEVKR
jgi:hypothetical protein